MNAARGLFVDPLGSWPGYDEFQFGRMLVQVMHSPESDRIATLAMAEARFPGLRDAMPDVCAIVAKTTSLPVASIEVIGLWIHADGSADYHCGSLDDGLEDLSVVVHRDRDGHLRNAGRVDKAT